MTLKQNEEKTKIPEDLGLKMGTKDEAYWTKVLEAAKAEVLKIQSYEVPCIFACEVNQLNKAYSDWIRGEVK